MISIPVGLAVCLAPCRIEFNPPRRADLLAGGDAVYLRIEKNALAGSTSKHMSKTGLVSHGLWYRCVWVEWRFGGFLDLRERLSSTLITVPSRSSYPNGPSLSLPLIKPYVHVLHRG